ncbi:hypothetical protein HMPREF1549_02132 [Actinomyces johnsonii F0510]|uniref:Uncharacterized protein n=1 Tax=Actinomyces johnsonii F0510 TaxID=1227262 RepID=U1Q649_9ACTO|nr:hypothetical protein HMPREF1549_02132 [Actinomyces johnsonii F0510]
MVTSTSSQRGYRSGICLSDSDSNTSTCAPHSSLLVWLQTFGTGSNRSPAQIAHGCSP